MKKSLSKFLIVCLISTMVLSTGCTGKGQQTGNEGVTQAFDSEASLFAEEEGPFFLLSQSSIPDMSEEVIPEDWSPVSDDGGGRWETLGYSTRVGEFNCKLFYRRIIDDSLVEMYKLLGESRNFEEGATSYLNVGIIIRVYSETEGIRSIAVNSRDLMNYDESIYRSIRSIAGIDGNKVYLITDKTIPDPQKENESINEYFISSIDFEGNLEEISEIPEQYRDWEFFLDKGLLCALNYGGFDFCRFDEAFSNPKDIKLPMRAEGFFTSKDGNSYLYGTRNNSLWIRDEAEQDPVYTLGEPYSFADYSDYSIAINDEGVVFAVDSDGSYRYENGKLTYCNFADQDIRLDVYNGAYMLDDGGFAVFGSCDGEYALFKANPCEENPKYMKTNITILAGYVDAIRFAARRYNRSNSDYRISFCEMEEDLSYEDFMNKFSAEMATGKGPDIVADYYIDFTSLARNGGIIPLDDVVEIDKSQYITSAFDGCTVNGKLYSIPYNVYIKSFVTSEEIAGGRSSWTLSEYMDAIENSGAEKAIDMSAFEIVTYFGLWDMSNKNVIDWDTRKSNMEGEEFVRLLEFAKKYAIEDGKQYELSTRQDIYDGKIACKNIYQLMGDNMAECDAYYRGTPSYIGFPSETGEGGSYIYPSGCLCVNADSKNTEGAKDFLRWLISEEGQRTINDYYYSKFYGDISCQSLRWDIIDKQIEDYNIYNDPEGHTEISSDGSAHLVVISGKGDGVVSPKDYRLTDEWQSIYKELIRSARPVNSEMMDIMYIFEEELGAFLAGQKTAEETAKVIDSRVQLYLDENG
ncbi:MAG: extracellular solute-binding protein [Lachnospiraceae bacterium]|nr:extracellular solute-binding protein [Lachnospiraceae bacterium]